MNVPRILHIGEFLLLFADWVRPASLDCTRVARQGRIQATNFSKSSNAYDP